MILTLKSKIEETRKVYISLAIFLLIRAELAIGIFNSLFAGEKNLFSTTIQSLSTKETQNLAI